MRPFNDIARRKATEEIWRLLKICERGDLISWRDAEDCVERIERIFSHEAE